MIDTSTIQLAVAADSVASWLEDMLPEDDPLREQGVCLRRVLRHFLECRGVFERRQIGEAMDQENQLSLLPEIKEDGSSAWYLGE